MQFYSLEHLLELINCGPEASMASRIVRVCLVACTIIAVAQLLTMWGTRWGDRQRLGKSLLLSVLVHLCLALSWVTAVEANRMTTGSDPEPETERVYLKLADQPLEQTPPSRAKSLQTLESVEAPFERRAQERPVNELASSPQVSPEPIRPKPPAAMETPRFEMEVARPDIPPRSELPDAQLAKIPVAATAIPDAEAQARPESAVATRSRTPFSRVAPQSLAPAPVERGTPESVRREPLVPAAMARLEAGPEVPMEAAKVESRARRQPRVRPPEEVQPVGRTILQGIVTDKKTGRPLARTTVRFDRAQGKPLVAVTRDDGTYELVLSDIPETFAVAASQAGYQPEALNLRSADVKGKTHRLDFTLRAANENVIVVENDPVVHHLGNDQFEGVANSKFQRRSEGSSFEAVFTVTVENSQKESARPTVTFLAKGVQCPPQVRINGHLLAADNSVTPDDGTYGTMVFPFDRSLLRAGKNQISVRATSCQGDLDDFEFVNPQIRLTKPK